MTTRPLILVALTITLAACGSADTHGLDPGLFTPPTAPDAASAPRGTGGEPSDDAGMASRASGGETAAGGRLGAGGTARDDAGQSDAGGRVSDVGTDAAVGDSGALDAGSPWNVGACVQCYLMQPLAFLNACVSPSASWGFMCWHNPANEFCTPPTGDACTKLENPWAQPLDTRNYCCTADAPGGKPPR